MPELSQIIAIAILVVIFVIVIVGHVLSIYSINCRKILTGYRRY